MIIILSAATFPSTPPSVQVILISSVPDSGIMQVASALYDMLISSSPLANVANKSPSFIRVPFTPFTVSIPVAATASLRMIPLASP